MKESALQHSEAAGLPAPARVTLSKSSNSARSIAMAQGNQGYGREAPTPVVAVMAEQEMVAGSPTWRTSA